MLGNAVRVPVGQDTAGCVIWCSYPVTILPISSRKPTLPGIARGKRSISMCGSLRTCNGQITGGEEMVRGIVGHAFPARFVGGVAPRRGGHDARPEGFSSESTSKLRLSSVTAEGSRQQTDEDPATELFSVNSATQLAFRVRSQSKVRVDDDGSIRAVNKTQLRFSYDLVSEDGQRIQLRAKAKIKQSVTLDENGDIAIKTRVKLQFSLIQKEVADGLNPLQGAQNEGDSNPLQAFFDVVDSVVSDYADDGRIDADTLIGNVLDEFNSLLANLSGGSQGPTDAEVSDAQVSDAGTNDGEVIAAQVIEARSQSSSPPDAEGGVDEAEAIAPVQPTIDAAETEAKDAGAILVGESPETKLESGANLVPTSLTGTSPVVASETEPTEDTLVNAADPETNVEKAHDVLQKVRIRFVQSFTQVIKTLTPNGEDDTSGLSLVQKSSFKLDVRAHYGASNTSGLSTDFLA